MRVREARKLCPQLRLVHVETISAGDGESGSPVKASDGPGGGGGGGGNGSFRRNEAKASLAPYREASGQIMALLGSVLRLTAGAATATATATAATAATAAAGGAGPGPGSGGCLLEKASVDEAFLDVTTLVDEELRQLEAQAAATSADGTGAGTGAGTGHPSAAAAAAGSAAATAAGSALSVPGAEELEQHGQQDGWGLEDEEPGGGGGGGGGGEAAGRLSGALLAAARQVAEASVVVGGPPQLMNETDRRLVVGGLIAQRLRRAVHEHLAFTCSAGVAVNKLLAKVASARNKPDKQTLVLPRGVADLLTDLPLAKLRGLGGKLGAALEAAFGAVTAGQVAGLPLEALQRALGERSGLWVSQVVRGQCSEPVTPKDKPKSLLSCKSFEPTSSPPELQRWLTILAEELVGRCAADEAAHRRRARTLVLHYRGPSPRERSVRCGFPAHGREGPSAAAIAKAAMDLLRRQSDAVPCSRLAIAAAEFDDPPAAGAAAITRFFTQPGQRAGGGCSGGGGGGQGTQHQPQKLEQQPKGQAQQTKVQQPAPRDLRALFAAPPPPQQTMAAAPVPAPVAEAAAAAGPAVEDTHEEGEEELRGGDGDEDRWMWSPGGIDGGGGGWSEGEEEGGLGAYGGQHNHDHPAKRRRTAEAMPGPPGPAAPVVSTQQRDTQHQQQQPDTQQQPASLADGSQQQQQALPASLAEWLPSASQQQQQQQQQHTHLPALIHPHHLLTAPPDLDPGGRAAPPDTGACEQVVDLDADPGNGLDQQTAAAAAPGPDPAAGGLDPGFGDVDLEEQRRILHEIELARLRALPGKPSNGGRAAGGGGAGRGGGRGRGGGKPHGRGAGAAPTAGTGGAGRGQMRLTALLQPGRGQQAQQQRR
ncbi:hypothetical protein HXX76_007650 [Chlamydomonas incerta]|uniref:DNA polymerase eta n=1 Tax=Chlamydomonas incerta TaxID=51695 RepID=A0A835TB34_CHLIN|nr:hypothetical protein HXX76_007650 [Chlamydomonas incerta]|eukprot:KAG2434765.1 hypothetical protein HXX76_007650 [Chlamydomonas incerta]